MDLFLIFPIQVFLPCQVLGYTFSEKLKKKIFKVQPTNKLIDHLREKEKNSK